MFNQAEIEKLLAEGIVYITFTKKNGDERVMKCTTNMEIIPSEQHPTGTGRSYEETKAVYDVIAEGWRSFRWDSVTEVTPSYEVD